MIHHAVFFKLVAEVDEVKLEEIIALTCKMLPQIPGVQHVRAGKNILGDAEWPFFLTVDLDSVEALEAYRIHPVHLEYVDAVVKPFTTERFALDYDTKLA